MIRHLKLLRSIDETIVDVEIEFKLIEGMVDSKFEVGNHSFKYRCVDIYECFMNFRREVESKGFFVLCNGGRIDVRPSGMLRDMSSGYKLYLLEMGKAPEVILELLEYSDENIGTLQDQDHYYDKWRRSLKM